MRNVQFDADMFRASLVVWRRFYSFTQQDVSKSSGVSIARIGIIERGEDVPQMAEFTHLCNMMETEVTLFFKKGK